MARNIDQRLGQQGGLQGDSPKGRPMSGREAMQQMYPGGVSPRHQTQENTVGYRSSSDSERGQRERHPERK